MKFVLSIHFIQQDMTMTRPLKRLMPKHFVFVLPAGLLGSLSLQSSFLRLAAEDAADAAAQQATDGSA